MKRKLLLSAIFLLCLLQDVSAQDYQPLLNNSTWIINDWVSCCRPPIVRTIEQATDSIIGEYTYKAYRDPFPSFESDGDSIKIVCLREDIATRKVYKIVTGEDALLYDFSLETGNTISQYGFTFVATTDETVVNGGMRKRITLESIETYNGFHFTQVWIEGVGTVAHPFYPNSNMFSVLSTGGGYNIYTKCSFQGNQYIYGNSDYCSSMLSTSSVTAVDNGIVLSPNPFSSELIIQSNTLLQNASVKLYNLQGQLVRESNNLNGQKLVINRGTLNSGSYFLQLFEDNKLIKVSKVLID